MVLIWTRRPLFSGYRERFHVFNKNGPAVGIGVFIDGVADADVMGAGEIWPKKYCQRRWEIFLHEGNWKTTFKRPGVSCIFAGVIGGVSLEAQIEPAGSL